MVEDLIRQLWQYDIERTEPEMLRRFLENTYEIKQDDKNLGTQINHCVNQDLLDCLINANILRHISRNKEIIAPQINLDQCFLGVDGSFDLACEIGGTYYFPISACYLSFDNSMDMDPKLEISPGSRIHSFRATEANIAYYMASLRSLTLETDILRRGITFESPNHVYIDGPIVDPPNRRRGRDYEEYIKFRLDVLTGTQILIVGVIKRVKSSYFIINQLLDSGCLEGNCKNLISQLRDKEVLDYIFTSFMLNNPNEIPYTAPIPLNPTQSSAYSDYHDAGLEIETFFTQVRVDTPPIRVEISARFRNVVSEVVAALGKLTLPGHFIPLPVALAHEKSLVRNGLAKSLGREILSRIPTNNLETIIKSKYGRIT